VDWLQLSAGLFAQDPAVNPPASFLQSIAVPLIAIGVLMYFMIIRPEKRKLSERSAMLSVLKKDDRVVTSSGIYGIVTNVHREADKVTLKIDEATNTKMQVTLSAIARVLGETSDTEAVSSETPR
jgi:preprotein translocase subunit YajC